MARIWTVAPPLLADTVFNPIALNREMREIHGEFNGRLDRENISGILTDTQVAADALCERYYAYTASSNSVTFDTNEIGWAYVPGPGGGDWIVDLTATEDCAVIVSAHIQADKSRLAYSITANGEIIAFRSENEDTTNTPVYLSGMALVGAGQVIVAVRAVSSHVSIGFAGEVNPGQVAFTERALSVRLLKR